MGKAARFESLEKLAGGQEAGAARRLAHCLSDLNSKQEELRKLRSYLEDYARESEREDQFVDTARWNNTRQFLNQLSNAVTVREAEFETAAERYRQEVERWRSCHRQTRALKLLVDKYCDEELQELERREQKELDEQVSRRVED